MSYYIDKDAVMAEIERIQNEFSDSSDRNGNFDDLENQGAYKALDRLESSLDTLEMKEVDLEKEVNAYMVNEMKFLSDEVGYDTLSTIAHHFFELGLKAQKGEEV